MAGLYFAHNGLLNDWAASNGIEVVDAGQPCSPTTPPRTAKA